MIEWYRAGGFGMFPILFLGLGALVVGARAVREPTGARVATLRSLTTLILLCALFAFGSNLWAVNVHISDPAFVKAHEISAAELPLAMMFGLTEAGQALTLGGLLAALAAALRLVAELKLSKSQPA